jgi:hypothetical protein
MKSKLIGKYIVVETNNNNDIFDLANAEVRGFFDSKEKVEKYLRENALENFDLNFGEVHTGQDAEWGSNLLVCKVIRPCRQVPSVKVSVCIKDIEEDK